MSAATSSRYGHMAIGVASRAHVGTAWTAMHVLPGVKPSFIEDATAHRRVPEVLPT